MLGATCIIRNVPVEIAENCNILQPSKLHMLNLCRAGPVNCANHDQNGIAFTCQNSSVQDKMYLIAFHLKTHNNPFSV